MSPEPRSIARYHGDSASPPARTSKSGHGSPADEEPIQNNEAAIRSLIQRLRTVPETTKYADSPPSLKCEDTADGHEESSEGPH